MTSRAKIVQLEPKVEHAMSLTHLGLGSNLVQSKSLLIKSTRNILSYRFTHANPLA